MCIRVTNQRIPVGKEQLNSPAKSGVYVKHLVSPERHTAFMKLAIVNANFVNVNKSSSFVFRMSLNLKTINIDII